MLSEDAGYSGYSRSPVWEYPPAYVKPSARETLRSDLTKLVAERSRILEEAQRMRHKNDVRLRGVSAEEREVIESEDRECSAIRNAEHRARLEFSAAARTVGAMVLADNSSALDGHFPDGMVAAAAQGDMANPDLFAKGTAAMQELAGSLDLLAHLPSDFDSSGQPQWLIDSVAQGVDRAVSNQAHHETAQRIAKRSSVPNSTEALFYLEGTRIFVVSEPNLPTGARLEIAYRGSVVEEVTAQQFAYSTASLEFHAQWMAQQTLGKAGCPSASAAELSQLNSRMGSLGRPMMQLARSVASHHPTSSQHRAELSLDAIAGWLDKADSVYQVRRNAAERATHEGTRSTRKPLAFLAHAASAARLPRVPEFKFGDLAASVQLVAPAGSGGFGL